MEEAKKIELLEKIDNYIKGRLSQDEIEALWIEFLKYPDMFRYFETQVQIQDMIKNGEVPESFRQNRVEEPAQTGPAYRVWFYAAAAALIVAIGLQFFGVPEQNGNAGRWALAEIELDEMVGSDVYRSDENETESIEADLQINSAMAMAYNDSTEAAIETFRELLNEDLNDGQLARAKLNIGILLYNNGDYREAKKHLGRVTRFETVRESLIEKAWWLYGNALLQSGDIAGAREALQNSYEMKGRFQNPADALLKKLDSELPDNSLGADQTP